MKFIKKNIRSNTHIPTFSVSNRMFNCYFGTINAFISLSFIYSTNEHSLISFDWKSLQIFFFSMFTGHTTWTNIVYVLVYMCGNNRFDDCIYQFDLRNFLFWFSFIFLCTDKKNKSFFRTFYTGKFSTLSTSACSRLNSLSHSVRVKSPNIIIDISIRH